jgi:hypothetical protein
VLSTLQCIFEEVVSEVLNVNELSFMALGIQAICKILKPDQYLVSGKREGSVHECVAFKVFVLSVSSEFKLVDKGR